MNHLLREEAVLRQGSTVLGRFVFAGDPNRACFESGSEGVVQLATDLKTGQLCRIKCFWEPDGERLRRSQLLVAQELAFTGVETGDALGGAPYELLPAIGGRTPFALVMKNIKGRSWRSRKELAIAEGQNPPKNWPALPIRATWAYGLATAIHQLEERKFIHSDISDGNVVVDASGDCALVDFDAYLLHGKHMLPLCRGSEGYAAPEIYHCTAPGTRRPGWLKRSQTRLRGSSITIGSDRLGLALLVQEFLLMGQRDLSFDESFGWGYRQVEDLCARSSGAHPTFTKTYPALAKLVDRALRAALPRERPSPREWREELKPIAEGTAHQETLMIVSQHPTTQYAPAETIAPNMNLARTAYGIRATVVKVADGSLVMEVQPGATVFVRGPGSGWEEKTAGSRIPIYADLMFFDQKGSLPARIGVQARP